MVSVRLLAIAALVVAVMTTTTGCTDFFRVPPPIPTEEEIVGSWSAVEPGGEISTLEFVADGTFTAKLPQDLFNVTVEEPEDFDWSPTIEGGGTWSIAQTAPGTPQEVEFVLTSPTDPGVIGVFWVKGEVGARQIFKYVGSIDNGVEFVFTREFQ